MMNNSIINEKVDLKKTYKKGDYSFRNAQYLTQYL